LISNGLSLYISAKDVEDDYYLAHFNSSGDIVWQNTFASQD